MGRAHNNPIGIRSPTGLQVVRVGRYGQHTHILNPKTGRQLCLSGFGRAKGKQQIFEADAEYVTCYRCAKLARINGW